MFWEAKEVSPSKIESHCFILLDIQSSTYPLDSFSTRIYLFLRFCILSFSFYSKKEKKK